MWLIAEDEDVCAPKPAVLTYTSRCQHLPLQNSAWSFASQCPKCTVARTIVAVMSCNRCSSTAQQDVPDMKYIDACRHNECKCITHSRCRMETALSDAVPHQPASSVIQKPAVRSMGTSQASLAYVAPCHPQLTHACARNCIPADGRCCGRLCWLLTAAGAAGCINAVRLHRTLLSTMSN